MVINDDNEQDIINLTFNDKYNQPTIFYHREINFCVIKCFINKRNIFFFCHLLISKSPLLLL